MSYARFGASSDVYVYDDAGGYIACCGCILGNEWDFHSVDEIVTHMQEHVDAGHKVNPSLLDPDTFSDCRFVAMCHVFMCREDEGHDGEHTPLRAGALGDLERLQAIRDRQIGVRP